MATKYLTPTPLPREAGPYIVVDLPPMTGVDTLELYGGHWEKTPQIWQMESLYLTLTCSADVANRSLRVYQRSQKINEAYNNLWYVKTPSITASQVKTFNIAPFGFVEGSAEYGADFAMGIHFPISFGGFEYLYILTAAGEAADALIGKIKLKYMNRELRIPTPYND